MNPESILFTPIRVGSAEIPNRFVRSATHDFMADDDGRVTPRQVELFRTLAEAEIGLIITGHAYVNRAGRASPRQIGVDSDRMIPGLGRIPEAVHEHPSRVFLQISHAGRQTKEKLCGCTPLAPSEVFEPTFKVNPRPMSAADIGDTIGDFIRAAVRARKAGFDGVQIHVAHGYLLSSFISPYTNRRSDEWGGSLTNRIRIVIEIVRGIKKDAGGDFPLIAKLNASDFLPGGLTIEDSLETARRLVEEGLDGIEVSGGMSEAGKGSMWKGLRPESEEGYFVDSARLFKETVPVPVFGLGGIRSLTVMERIVVKGRADLISLSRPLIRDPFLVRRFRLGEKAKSECISCNGCLNPRGISCSELRKKSRAEGSNPP